MNKNLKELLESVKTWPGAAQEEAASALQSIKADVLETYELIGDDRLATCTSCGR